jgi:glycosyl transferase family 25
MLALFARVQEDPIKPVLNRFQPPPLEIEVEKRRRGRVRGRRHCRLSMSPVAKAWQFRHPNASHADGADGGAKAMKAYYINLDRSVGRRDWFERQARRLGVEFERVAAVDAAALPETELARLRAAASVPLSAGEIGCFLSHRHIWEMIAGREDEWAFVAEDDVHFSTDAGHFLSNRDWLPAGVELVKAETWLTRLELSRAVYGQPLNHELRRLRSKHFGSAGYFVSRAGAARLLAFTADRCNPVDLVLFSPRLGIIGVTVVLQLAPAICIQDALLPAHAESTALASLIQPKRREGWDAGAPRSAWRKIRREIARVGQQIAGAIRLATMILTGRSIVRKIEMAPIE